MIRQMKIKATVPVGDTGVTADSDTIHGKILKVAFAFTGNSMDVNLDTLGEPKAQAIIDYTGNTDSTFYPRVPVSLNTGGETVLWFTALKVYEPYTVFGKLRLTLASAAAGEIVVMTITYEE